MAEAEARKDGRQPPLLYAFVARRAEVLAECTEHGSSFVGFVAKSMLKHPLTDFSRQIDGHVFRYTAEDDTAFCVVAHESTGQEILNGFLEKLKRDFKQMCIGGKVNVAADGNFDFEFRTKLKEHMLYCIENSHETGIPEIQGVVPEKIDNECQAINEDQPIPAYIHNIFEKYHNIWIEEFSSAQSKFETEVSQIHMRNISALKAELISKLATGTKENAAARGVIGPHTALMSNLISKLRTRADAKGVTEAHTIVTSPRKGRHAKNTCAVPNVAIIYDDRMLAHQPPKGKDFDEKPERILKIKERLVQEGLWERCRIFESDEAKIESLEAVHTPAHVLEVKKFLCVDSDSDMYSSIGTTKAAFLAAGGVLKAAELVAKGDVEAAFAIVRPPGHHVGITGPPRGFCFFNNISIAAANLLDKHGMKKILILDWDIHHGDGTQEVFYNDKRVLFFSLHRADNNFYPKESRKGLDNLGKGSGLGYNINICWRHSKIRDVDYHSVWDHLLVPITQEFEPELILVSCGFDAAKGDKLGKCDVTPNGFATLLRKLKPIAPVVMALEGGYNVVSISQSAAACVKVLLGDKSETIRDRSSPYATTRSLIVEAREKLRPYWKCLASEITEDVMANTISAPRTTEPQLP